MHPHSSFYLSLASPSNPNSPHRFAVSALERPQTLAYHFLATGFWYLVSIAFLFLLIFLNFQFSDDFRSFGTNIAMVYGGAILCRHRKLVLCMPPLGEWLLLRRKSPSLMRASYRRFILHCRVFCIHRLPKCWCSSRLTENCVKTGIDQRAWSLSCTEVLQCDGTCSTIG